MSAGRMKRRRHGSAMRGFRLSQRLHRPYASMNWIRFNGSLRALAVSQPLAGTPLVNGKKVRVSSGVLSSRRNSANGRGIPLMPFERGARHSAKHNVPNPILDSRCRASLQGSGSLKHCMVGHGSMEPGHWRLLEHRGLRLLLDFGLCEGTGAVLATVLATVLARAAPRCHLDSATFTEAGMHSDIEGNGTPEGRKRNRFADSRPRFRSAVPSFGPTLPRTMRQLRAGSLAPRKELKRRFLQIVCQFDRRDGIAHSDKTVCDR